MFAVEGHWRGRPVRVTWDDGRLGGDPACAAFIRAEARRLEGQYVGLPTGPGTMSGHLAEPLSALILIAEILSPVERFTGDVPESPPIPPGAVA